MRTILTVQCHARSNKMHQEDRRASHFSIPKPLISKPFLGATSGGANYRMRFESSSNGRSPAWKMDYQFSPNLIKHPPFSLMSIAMTPTPLIKEMWFTWPLKFHKALYTRQRELKQSLETIISFQLHIQKAWIFCPRFFQAGQYLCLGWKGEFHPFTLTSAPEDLLDFLHWKFLWSKNICFGKHPRY